MVLNGSEEQKDVCSKCNCHLTCLPLIAILFHKMQLSPACTPIIGQELLWKMILLKRKKHFVLLLSHLSPECNMKPKVPIHGVESTQPRNLHFYIQLLLSLNFVNLRPLEKEKIILSQ